MFKEIVLITLLAAAVSGFSTSGADDLATAQRSEAFDNHPSNSDIVVPKDELPGSNPVDLIDNPAESAVNSKRTRRCIKLGPTDCQWRYDPHNPLPLINHIDPWNPPTIYDDRGHGDIFGGIFQPRYHF